MLRVIENADTKKIIELLTNINFGVTSMINDYFQLYTEQEIKTFRDISKIIFSQIQLLENGIISIEKIYSVLKYEEYLKPYIFRCWDYHISNGYQYVSWFKNDNFGDMPQIISATFSLNGTESFCDSTYGINYKVFIDGFLGALNRDAATLIEDKSKQSIYTIAFLDNDIIVNSYNLATPIITPKQVLDKRSNTYKSKHNEIILDSRYVQPKSVIYYDNSNLDIVDLISSKYSIPSEHKISR